MTLRRLAAVLIAVAALVEGGRAAWIPAKAVVAQLLLEDAWRRSTPGEAVRPWAWADTWPVARLRWPDGGVDRIVLAGASGQALAFGPGHAAGTGAPGGDDNCVLAGHRDTHFAFLARLRPGDVLEIETPDRRRHRYRVTATEVTHRDDTRFVTTTDVGVLTLVTCWPFVDPTPGGPERYVVRAVRES